jgi:hypothetical protein
MVIIIKTSTIISTTTIITINNNNNTINNSTYYNNFDTFNVDTVKNYSRLFVLESNLFRSLITFCEELKSYAANKCIFN